MRSLEITLLLFYMNFLVIFSVCVHERFDGKAGVIIPLKMKQAAF